MAHLSVCIPTYEMHGKGAEFLAQSFNMLTQQTFQDFDVVISDNAQDNSIRAVCDEYAPKLTIHYFKNQDPAHGMSSNVNNAIQNATGRIIKILFLDDLLASTTALQTITDNFDTTTDTWMAVGCSHTRDGKSAARPHTPTYNDRIHLGKNTIGSPSVIVLKNETPLLFDTKLKWLMDCDYYKRCHDTFGEPKLLNDILVMIRVGDHQVTNQEVTRELVATERAYLEQKERAKKVSTPISLPTVTLVAVTGIDPTRAAEALELSMLGMEYADVVLISHHKPVKLNPKIRFVQCKETELVSQDPKNTDDYSKFMAYNLADYITTDFALIVHHRAHVLYPHRWDPIFLQYDYIGAPWPQRRHYTNEGVEVRVGNGGFSLRSKKMLGILRELHLPFTDDGTGFFHEDGILCVYYREQLEAAGIRFAPVEIAAQFAHELDCPESVTEPFGYHDYPDSSRFHRLKKVLKKIQKNLC